jgi:GTPase SAR1 family protein
MDRNRCCNSGKYKKAPINKGLKMSVSKPSRPMHYEDVIKPQTIIDAKIVLLGDSGVGKSSVAQRYCKDTFSENYDVTIGGAYMQ